MKIACIGSRDISTNLAASLSKIARQASMEGHQILSGNATGSDYAYAQGANLENPNSVTLYLPWRTYNVEHFVPGNIVIFDPLPEWTPIARRNHPIYGKLPQSVKKLMDRNAGIVLDADVVLAVLNHNKPGFGGTGHGWRIAGELNKPRIDLSTLESGLSTEEVGRWLKKVEEKIEKPLTGV